MSVSLINVDSWRYHWKAYGTRSTTNVKAVVTPDEIQMPFCMVVFLMCHRLFHFRIYTENYFKFYSLIHLFFVWVNCFFLPILKRKNILYCNLLCQRMSHFHSVGLYSALSTAIVSAILFCTSLGAEWCKIQVCLRQNDEYLNNKIGITIIPRT